MPTLLATRVAFPLLLAATTIGGSADGCSRPQNAPLPDPAKRRAVAAADAEFVASSERMVREQIEARGVRDPRVLAAMRRVPRHLFVPQDVRALAYEDHPLPIGHGQTISQPFIVAWMTEALQVGPDARILEVGTGSAYQAAVLGELVRDVYTIELVAPLAESARRTLDALGYKNVHVKHGDGYVGWAEHAPFDAIIVTAAPDHVPQPLVDQLRVGARLVIPVGGRAFQQMLVVTKRPGGVTTEERMAVRFVPLVRQ